MDFFHEDSFDMYVFQCLFFFLPRIISVMRDITICLQKMSLQPRMIRFFYYFVSKAGEISITSSLIFWFSGEGTCWFDTLGLKKNSNNYAGM